MHKVSIIVPIYNAERYLHRCLDSILAQTFTDFETILVDDGSPDGSGKICDEYASIDSRFKVIHQINKGVSAARNAGIEIAKGNWIAFVDSDDSVLPNYLLDLYEATKNEIEGSYFVFQGLYYYNDLNEKTGSKCFESTVIDKSKFSRLFHEFNIHEIGYPFSKLYNRKVLNEYNIRFNENIHCSEDLLFMLDVLNVSNAVVIRPSSNYCYFQQLTGTLSSKINSYESEMDMFLLYKKILRKNKNNWGLSEQDLVYNNMRSYLYRALISYYKNSDFIDKKRLGALKYTLTNHKESLFQYSTTTPIIILMKIVIKYLPCFISDKLLYILLNRK